MRKKMSYVILLLLTVFLVGCAEVQEEVDKKVEVGTQEEVKIEEKESDKKEVIDLPAEEQVAEEQSSPVEVGTFEGYELIEVDGGNMSGQRKANVVVDIGFGAREYWAFTNENGQLVRVVAKEIILQDDDNEPVTSSGRYYSDAASVPGVESNILDKGHVIADSLGGVANAYNITPQESTLNRHGDQAYMERTIREAGGATNFEAIIAYANATTQIPSKYKFTYTVMGNVVVDEFNNASPEQINEALGVTERKATDKPASNSSEDVSAVDTNGNGQVTIKEAKDAGFSMPITRDHWLYQYMDDRDGDGMVGE